MGTVMKILTCQKRIIVSICVLVGLHVCASVEFVDFSTDTTIFPLCVIYKYMYLQGESFVR